MKYDFTSILDRKGHDAIALDVLPMEGAEIQEGYDAIPMWIADMNYPAFPGITDAVGKRLREPHFGYFEMSGEYYDAIRYWQKERFGVTDLPTEAIGYENGVLGGVASAIRAFTAPGDKILLHSPVYIGFTHTLSDLGRTAVHSDLYRDENGVWRIDYDDMEKKLTEEKIHFMIFCSPHNPVGRVWEREEILKVTEICRKHDCLILSDEIWSDLVVMPDKKHIPTQSVSEDAKNRTIAMYAPSKTFNLAGLIGSYHIIYQSMLRDRVLSCSRQTHYNACNIFSMHALTGAFTSEGQVWVDELREVLWKNVCRFMEMVEKIPGIQAAVPQGTYMIYLDCSRWCEDHKMTIQELQKKGISYGVIWQDGRPFGRPDSIRINLALPQSRVEEAICRLETKVFV